MKVIFEECESCETLINIDNFVKCEVCDKKSFCELCCNGLYDEYSTYGDLCPQCYDKIILDN